MSFETYKVKITFDLVTEGSPDSVRKMANASLSHDILHRVRVALQERKDFLITTPKTELTLEKK